jgi:hypothetical protein
MKQKMITLFAVALLLASTTFANKNGEPSLQIINEFNRMFTNTTGASWQEVSGFYRVTFIQGGQDLNAYYNASGEFASLSRNIGTTVLPLLLQKELKNKLSGSWVTESFELSRESGTEYYVTVEDANTKTVYHSDRNVWTMYKRTQK